MFYQNDLAMRNTAAVIGGKPIAVILVKHGYLGGLSEMPLLPLQGSSVSVLIVSNVCMYVCYRTKKNKPRSAS
jgi:hypothetical protein